MYSGRVIGLPKRLRKGVEQHPLKDIIDEVPYKKIGSTVKEKQRAYRKK